MSAGGGDDTTGGARAQSPETRDDDDGDAVELENVELIAVAKIVKVRGVRGEVAAELLTDFPERFEGLEELIAVRPAGGREALAVEECWLHGGRVVLKFENYDSPESAQELVGCELAVPETEAVELAEGEFYEWQLVGCRAETVEGRPLGTVRELLRTGGAAPVLVIESEAGREHLVPFAESICVEIDIGRKLIRVDAPDGLLEF